MRRDDWAEQLHATIRERGLVPFAWGIQDCATFASACVKAMTGVDPLADLERWNDERSAARVMAALGGLEAACDAKFSPKPATHAQRGDLVMVEQGNRMLLGVCLGPVLAAPGEQALMFMPMSAARRAWVV